MDTTIYLIIFFASCILIFSLCVYKVYSWYKGDDVKEKFDKIREDRKRYVTYSLLEKVKSVRFLLMCLPLFIGVFSYICLELYPFVEKKVIGYTIFGTFIIVLVANNFIVSRLWVCPFCKRKLPVRGGRAGIRPRTVDECPNCNRKLIQ